MEGVVESRALEIALRTMKERCYHLQQRLNIVEEENFKLREKLRSNSSSHESIVSDEQEESLHKQISLLLRQKAQLSHHICMVANENRTLWKRLSKLTLDNHNLGSHLTKISDTLNKHGASPDLQLNDVESNQKVNKYGSSLQESLEEISLKLINGILLEKTELESQYAQMVDLQSENEKSLDIQNMGFSFPDEEESNILSGINVHFEQLKKFKVLLNQEKQNLQSALQNLQNLKLNYTCVKCKNDSLSAEKNINVPRSDLVSVLDSNMNNEIENSTDNQFLNQPSVHYTRSSTIELSEPIEPCEEVQADSKICPMCGEQFLGDMNQFCSHVSSHFSDDEMNDPSNTFEVV